MKNSMKNIMVQFDGDKYRVFQSTTQNELLGVAHSLDEVTKMLSDQFATPESKVGDLMSWAKDDDGHPYYKEVVGDYCILKIESWEHGYLVSVADKDDTEEDGVTLQYFYTFQDARAFFTTLSRLIKRSNREQKS